MKKVLLIDNGRKYFSKEQLIQIIKKQVNVDTRRFLLRWEITDYAFYWMT
ncbi:hypothetical protein SNF32_05690 [Enterococcus mundtii]|nr:hypothetical protein [Enterococcus mundtii]